MTAKQRNSKKNGPENLTSIAKSVKPSRSAKPAKPARAAVPTLDLVKRAKQLTSREELLTMPVETHWRGRWEDDLPPEVRADLDDVKAAIKNGEIKHSKSAVFAYLKQKHGLTVTSGSFLSFLDR